MEINNFELGFFLHATKRDETHSICTRRGAPRRRLYCSTPSPVFRQTLNWSLAMNYWVTGLYEVDCNLGMRVLDPIAINRW